MITPPDNGVRYEQVGGLPAFLVDHLGRETGLRHAIFTRRGGSSSPPYASLNLGQMVGDDPRAVDINHRRVHRSLGIHARQLVTCHLVHGNHVFVVDEADGGQLVGQGDALVTDQPGLFLSMRFADCLPILINDSERHVVGLVHAGWRGTMLNVVGAAVEAMVGELGCSPDRITAVIGPGIGPCCYQVGDEVIEAVDAVFGEDKRVLSRRVGHQAYCDLWEANRLQLLKAGVKDVTVMGMCTACNTDHFFSHRAERGKDGAFWCCHRLPGIGVWMDPKVDIAANLSQVQSRIEAASFRAGRDSSEVTLVAVTKTHSVEIVQAAYLAGARHFGENRVEEGRQKIPAFQKWLAETSKNPQGPVWHMIGHVQHRKAADAVAYFQLVQSVDSLRLAERLNRLNKDGPPLAVLLECNVSGEDSKHGFPLGGWESNEELRTDFLTTVRQLLQLPQLDIQGLMTMAPIAPDPEQTRPVFASMRSLQGMLREAVPNLDWRHLSMGMTDDFEVAVEEGATMVRVGRAIFGERRVRDDH